MDQHQLMAVQRALTGMPSRRDVLRGLTAAGLSLAAFTLRDAEAKKRGRKKKLQGDSRCKGREVMSSNGVCLDLLNPVLANAVLCSALQGCVCATDLNGGHACMLTVGPLCQTTCLSNDDCEPDTVCVNIEGCCGDQTIVRTCAMPCPPT
jgi:hypothetical protein